MKRARSKALAALRADRPPQPPTDWHCSGCKHGNPMIVRYCQFCGVENPNHAEASDVSK